MEVVFQFMGPAWKGDEAALRERVATKVAEKVGAIPFEDIQLDLNVVVEISASDTPEGIAERVAARAAKLAALEAPYRLEQKRKFSVVPDVQRFEDLVKGDRIDDAGFRREVARMHAALKHPEIYIEHRGMGLWWKSVSNPNFRMNFDSSFFDHLKETEDASGAYRTFLFRNRWHVNFGQMNYYFIGMMYKAGGFSKERMYGEIFGWKKFRYGNAGEPIDRVMAGIGYDEYDPETGAIDESKAVATIDMERCDREEATRSQ